MVHTVLPGSMTQVRGATVRTDLPLRASEHIGGPDCAARSIKSAIHPCTLTCAPLRLRGPDPQSAVPLRGVFWTLPAPGEPMPGPAVAGTVPPRVLPAAGQSGVYDRGDRLLLEWRLHRGPPSPDEKRNAHAQPTEDGAGGGQ